MKHAKRWRVPASTQPLFHGAHVNFYLTCLLPVLVATATQAQTLDAFLASAAARNVDARLGAKSEERAQADAARAWAGLLPSLTANGAWTHNQYTAELEIPKSATETQKVIITPQNQLDATFKVELPLIDASKWLQTASAFASAHAASERSHLAQETTRRQVTVAYYAFASANAVLESAKRSMTVAQTQAEYAIARQQAGAATELDVVRAQTEVERVRQLIADAQSLVATSGRTLRTLSGLEPREVAPIAPDALQDEAPLAEFEAKAATVTSVRAADRDLEAANRASTAAALVLVPTVTAQFTERLTNATGFQNANTLYNAGIGFSWRLDAVGIQGFRGQQLQSEIAALNADKARDAAVDQVHSDWQRVKASIEKVRAAAAQVTSARRGAALASERYRAGVATQLDVISADRDVFSAEVNDIQARFDLASARASLRISAGTWSAE